MVTRNTEFVEFGVNDGIETALVQEPPLESEYDPNVAVLTFLKPAEPCGPVAPCGPVGPVDPVAP